MVFMTQFPHWNVQFQCQNTFLAQNSKVSFFPSKKLPLREHIMVFLFHHQNTVVPKAEHDSSYAEQMLFFPIKIPSSTGTTSVTTSFVF